MQRPLFLMSLPRAGSTLVQRVLAAHDQIATASEPWLLLPQIYIIKGRGMYAEYNQRLATEALSDFMQELPGGPDDYFAELRQFVLQLYRRASRDGAHYFLDKTPRYHLVAADVFRLFPDAKFIFLWRNPLAVVSSLVETWAGGKWSPHRWRVDLFDGLANLVSAYEGHADEVCAVRYEDLISSPEASWPRLFEYLEIPFDPESLTGFQRVELKGRMGDPSGSRQYQALSKEPLKKWMRSLDNPFRKAWCRRYLNWVGEHRLSLMGYCLDDLLRELEGMPVRPRRLGSDVARAAYGQALTAWRKAALN